MIGYYESGMSFGIAAGPVVGGIMFDNLVKVLHGAE